ncbi:hypothetical protein P8452_41476 [Trifolium repens]|nr:hypothetical protein P8452_41476 [Trifolium repens]
MQHIRVYPAIVHVAGTSVPFTTGFSLQPGESKVLTMSDSWLGKLWGRTYCSTDSTGVFACLTGECASSTMECDGRDSTSPATLAEFNLNTKSNGIDYSGVSVVNGYNLPIMVQPQVGGGSDGCLMTSCMVHLNQICPLQLKMMRGRDCIGCKSTGQTLSKYSESFKKACPRANVNSTETFQAVCLSTNYVITFCPRIEHEEYSTYVENSMSKKKGYINNNIFKIILAVVSIVAGGGALYFAISCYISYSTIHGWDCGFGARFRRGPNYVPDNSL